MLVGRVLLLLLLLASLLDELLEVFLDPLLQRLRRFAALGLADQLACLLHPLADADQRVARRADVLTAGQALEELLVQLVLGGWLLSRRLVVLLVLGRSEIVQQRIKAQALEDLVV